METPTANVLSSLSRSDCNLNWMTRVPSPFPPGVVEHLPPDGRLHHQRSANQTFSLFLFFSFLLRSTFFSNNKKGSNIFIANFIQVLSLSFLISIFFGDEWDFVIPLRLVCDERLPFRSSRCFSPSKISRRLFASALLLAHLSDLWIVWMNGRYFYYNKIRRTRAVSLIFAKRKCEHKHTHTHTHKKPKQKSRRRHKLLNYSNEIVGGNSRGCNNIPIKKIKTKNSVCLLLLSNDPVATFVVSRGSSLANKWQSPPLYQ